MKITNPNTICIIGFIGSLLFLCGWEHFKAGNQLKASMFLLISSMFMLSLVLAGCAQQPPPPVIVQAAPTPKPAPYIPDDPYASLSGDEVWAIQHNDLRTLYHGITTVYAYSPDTEYPLHCQRLHVTEIRLRPDEVTNKDNVKIGDKDRWGVIVGDHTVLVFPTGSSTSISLPGAQMTIPADPDMVTNLAIHTSLGNDYIFDPVRATSKKDYDRAVAFYYPESVRQQAAEREAALKQENKP